MLATKSSGGLAVVLPVAVENGLTVVADGGRGLLVDVGFPGFFLPPLRKGNTLS